MTVQENTEESRWPSYRVLLLVFLTALAFRILTALPLNQPGYMDAYYYYHVAQNLHAGRGFVEDLIFNYLGMPSAITHPSNLYWMPLPSILTWMSFALAGASYRASQVPSVLLSAMVPVLAFALSYRLFGRTRYAIGAALLGAFSGFYTVYWVAPDNFAPFAVAGTLALICTYRGMEGDGLGWWAGAGALSALGHLARADGVLFLLIALSMAAFVAWLRRERSESLAPMAWGAAAAVVSYLAVMAPWFYRNWTLIGAPISPSGTKTLFLRDYDDFFSYARDLSWQSYRQWGLGQILLSKLRAAAFNLTVVLGGLLFYLAPFSVLGLWKVRRRREVWPFFLYAASLYAAMTLAFTFPSMRGSMLHSTTALLPFLYAAVPAGIGVGMDFVAKRRSTWDPATARRFFGIAFIGLAVFVSLFIYVQAVFMPSLTDPDLPRWNDRNRIFVTAARWLDAEGRGDATVMVLDPPAYQYLVGRPAIVIPNDAPDVVVQVCRRYGAEYLILGSEHPKPLTPFYLGQAPHPDLVLLKSFGSDPERATKLFEVRGP
jgi:4-amino-4-deoxy-L-arabinose transferase-like glycosyltransferase